MEQVGTASKRGPAPLSEELPGGWGLRHPGTVLIGLRRPMK